MLNHPIVDPQQQIDLLLLRHRRRCPSFSRLQDWRLTLVLLCCDLALACGLSAIAAHAFFDLARKDLMVALSVSIVASSYIFGGYRIYDLLKNFTPATYGLLCLLGSLTAQLIFASVGLIDFSSASSSYTFTTQATAAYLLSATAGTVLPATLVRLYLSQRIYRSFVNNKVVLIGSEAKYNLLVSRITNANFPLPRFVRYYDTALDTQALPYEKLASEESEPISACVVAADIDNLPPAAVNGLVYLKLLGVPIRSFSQFVEEICYKTPLAHGDHWWIIDDYLLSANNSRWYMSTKRMVDIVISLIVLILCAPLCLVVGLLIKCSSRGPVIYTQVREGQYKQPFVIYKFRTMRVDAEQHGAVWAGVNDPRVTAIGKFLRKTRIDELPQMLNVLKGDMSLVGPRPERPEFNRVLEQQIPWYDLRFLAKPGITGWAQIMYPYGASVEDAIAKLEYDVYWLKHTSLMFDLRIILRTIKVVLIGYGR